MSNKNRKKLSPRIFFILVMSALFLLLLLCTKQLLYPEPSGRILLRRQSSESPYGFELLVMDGDGNNVQWVGNFTGSSAWSPDGRRVAAGCPPVEGNVTELCILDMETLPDIKHMYPTVYFQASPDMVQKIPLPVECLGFQYDATSHYSGIISLSWSPDQDRILLVCGEIKRDLSNEVCILSMDGTTSCWDDAATDKITRAVWSPREDVILVAVTGPTVYDSKIYIFNSEGTNLAFLVDGWSPEWSPDGKQLAYIKCQTRADNGGCENIGIANIDKNGGDSRWLFLPGVTVDTMEPIFLNSCWESSGTCRLSWSPDGRYITFVASQGDFYAYELYRLDIKTSEILTLLDSKIFGSLLAEPDWGP